MSGQYLTVGSAGVNVYETKTWGSLVAFEAGAVSGNAFGPSATFIAAGSSDGVVKVYGA